MSRRPRPRLSASTRSRRCPNRRRASGSSCAPAATPPISGSGCAGSPASLAWTAPGARRRWQMQFSKWHALGNSYLVVEQPDAGPLDARSRAAALLGRDGHRLRRRARGHAPRAERPRSSRSGIPTARPRRCPATASASPPAGSPRRPARREVTIETAGRQVAARMLNTLDTDTDVGERRRSGRPSRSTGSS